VEYGVTIADDQCLLWYRDSNVLARPQSPHFHALYGEYEAVFDVRDLRVLRGALPRRAMALVLEWATDHRDELMEDWNLCSQLKAPKPIDPLT
jgi:hypothetical protein